MQHGDGVIRLVVTRDGQKIISGAKERNIKVWDVALRVSEWTHPDEYSQITISSGSRLVTGRYLFTPRKGSDR